MPFGKYKRAKIFDEANILAASKALQKAETKIPKMIFLKRRIRDITFRVSASRAVNCDGEKRGKIKEILITNYSGDCAGEKTITA